MQALTPAAGDPVFDPTVEPSHGRIDADAYGPITSSVTSGKGRTVRPFAYTRTW